MTRKSFALRLRKFERIAPLPELEGKIPFKIDDYLVVDTNRGFECGKVIVLCPGAEKKHAFEVIINKVKRIASQEDLQKMAELDNKEEELIRIFNHKIEKYKLPIKLVGVEVLFDGHKVFFHYRTEEGDRRKKHVINLRPLIQDLNKELKYKVEIRQVGMRGEAKIMGGLGECGRTLCCASWLHKSKPITIKMAKEQGLAINIPKLSGVCGRLKCCIQYEKECYRDGRLSCAKKQEKPDDKIKEFADLFKEEEL
ncbi:stage 0 sporulation family protein [Candidatus Margulisiibacteriota bacterium]